MFNKYLSLRASSSASFFKPKIQLTTDGDFVFHYWGALVDAHPELENFSAQFTPNLKDFNDEKKICSLIYLLHYVWPYLINIREDSTVERNTLSKLDGIYLAISTLGKELLPDFDWQWINNAFSIPDELDCRLAKLYKSFLLNIINEYRHNFKDSNLIERLDKIQRELFKNETTFYDIVNLLSLEKDTGYRGNKGSSLLSHIVSAGILPLEGEVAKVIKPITAARKLEF